MNRNRLLNGLFVGVLTSVSLLLSAGSASATVHSLSFSGEVFQYSAGVLSSTNATVLLSYDHSPLPNSTHNYTLDLTGNLSGGGTTNGLLTNMNFQFKDNGNVIFSGVEAAPVQFHVVGNSAALLGEYTNGVAISPVAGMAPSGSFSIGLSGWNGVTTSGSGSGGTFTVVPEAGSSAAMAMLIVGGCVVGVRRRRTK